MRLRIATRKSPLALWQADAIAAQLRAFRPGVHIDRLEMTTSGDKFLEAPLASVGGKGLFVKEIEQALIEERAELAVHSLKDMTSQMPPGLVLAAVPPREDPRDAWVSPSGEKLEALPRGARVGTSSLRRACQLKALRSDFEIVPLRGNVQRRLDKVVEHGLAGAVLAAAGLHRLGLEGRITELLPPSVCLPAVGQGALAVQCRVTDTEVRGLLSALDHAPTRAVVDAERAFLARLEGGCTVPIAAYGELRDGTLWLRGLIGAPDGGKIVRADVRGSPQDGPRMGRELAERLLADGGAALLETFAAGPRS